MSPGANKDHFAEENVNVTPAENGASLETDDAIHQDEPLDTSFESTIPSPNDVESPATSLDTIRAITIVLRSLTQGINPAINDPCSDKAPYLAPSCCRADP